MYYRLWDIAEIRQGLALRSRVEHDPAGEVKLVQAKDLTDDGRVDMAGTYRVSGLRFKPAQRLQVGDVLLQTRGIRYPAAVANTNLGEAVAAAPLYVIRPKREMLDAIYLVEFLNNLLTQARLRQRATGTYVPQIPRTEIENIEIPVPPLDAQWRLAEMGRLIRRESDLVSQLAQRRAKALWAMMRQAAGEKTQGRSIAPGP